MRAHHYLAELGFPPTWFDLVECSRGCSVPGPTEFGAVNPDAVQDHGQPSRQRDNRSFHPAPFGIAQALSQDHFAERSSMA
jgi:hypothetical protein